ncbi:hypothetical protein I552_4016 [Mycobacterium xenopi 3993]|nr:hypothetical protein I552_4016 [Mycobacterium xenopi 3993]
MSDIGGEEFLYWDQVEQAIHEPSADRSDFVVQAGHHPGFLVVGVVAV